MALVAYENSDSSEFEDDNDEPVVVTFNKKIEVSETPPKPVPSVPNLVNGDLTEEGGSLFNLLPQPSTKKIAVVEDDDEFLKKKESVAEVKPKARITVPLLSDFKDVDEKSNKPKVFSGKKSGLLSILPQPRNAVTKTTKSLIPHVLTQKPSTPTVKKKEPLPSPMKTTKAEPKSTVTSYSDESDDDEVQNDFFSINKPIDIPIDDTPIDIDEPVAQNEQNADLSESERKAAKIQSYFKKDVVQSHVQLEPDHNIVVNSDMTEYDGSKDAGRSEYSYGEQASSFETNEVSNNEIALDEEAIMKLCGTRGKRKREEIQIVDVNQKDVLGDSREWLLKGLMDDTSKRVSSSKRRGNEPTSQQKRKHQITYLAHQAKANEAELQNQWANNRMSKRQTQSKYGF